MSTGKTVSVLLIVALLVAVPMLGACGATPTTAATQTPLTAGPSTALPTVVSSIVAPTKAPSTPTAVPPTPTPKGPTVGGNLIYALNSEVATLDPQKTVEGISWLISGWIGGSLLARDPKTGKYVPYLAESWTISGDGITWEFKIRKDIKFHDGTPCTAQDFLWTFNRALDPATKASAAGPLASVKSMEAPDDATFRLVLKAPSFPMMSNFVTMALMPLSKAAVEKWGDLYGRNPIGVGPYKFKEWKTGTSIVLERNPDYNWGPAFAHKGPWYCETVEFRFIPEASTVLAGVQAGELAAAPIPSKDVQAVTDSGVAQVLELLNQGEWFLPMNISKPPFDNLKVRQAFSHAVNRDAIVKVAVSGRGVALNGPLAPSVIGYWDGAEKLGYPYDVAKAKALLAEAGYVAGAGGIFEKEGQPLKLAIKCTSSADVGRKIAEVVQGQLKAIGVDAAVELTENATHNKNIASGNYQLAVLNYSYAEADILYMCFHSSMEGVMNLIHQKDEDLDKLLVATRTTMDPDARQLAVNQVVTRIVQQAYMVPLFAQVLFTAVNKKVAGVYASTVTGTVYFNDGYIVK